MKKIVYILLFITSLIFSSCNLERKPQGTPEQAPFTTLAEAQMNRDAVYALLRNVESPDNLNAPECQGDLYHLTFLDNNTIFGIYNWHQNALTDHSFLTRFYFNYYSTLMQANYFIMRAEELLNSETYVLKDNEKALLKQYIGEFKAIRALGHWRLVQRFSKPWDGVTDNDPENGIVVMNTYAPLETAQKPKSSRAEVYASMLEDVNQAIELIPEEANKETLPSIYITQDYAYGLKARICLTKKDYQGAFDAATRVIPKYQLMSTTGNRTDDIISLQRIWKTEDSPEIMVHLYATPQYGAVKSSYFFGGGYSKGYTDWDDWTNLEQAYHTYHSPYMILEQWVVDLYSDEDLRKEVYIGSRGFYRADWKGQIDFHALTKYEGNPSLNKDPNIPEFKFSAHLMHVAEMYLIASEAALELGNTAEVTNYLSQLQAARGLTFDVDAFSSIEDLRKEVRNERVRELVGEGFRIHDLMRWGEPVQRSESQKAPEAMARLINKPVVQEKGKLLRVEPDNKMFVWEFPTRDLETNPHLNDHRNW